MEGKTREVTVREVGGLGHLVSFIAVLAAGIVFMTAGVDAFTSWLTPSPPQDLRFLSDDESVELVNEYQYEIHETKDRERVFDQYMGEPYGPPGGFSSSFGPLEPDADVLWSQAIVHGRAVRHIQDRVGWMRAILLLVAGGFLCVRVGRSGADALLAMIFPPFGLYLVPKVAWRLTSPVPYWRDQPPPPRTPRAEAILVFIVAGLAVVAVVSFAVWFRS